MSDTILSSRWVVTYLAENREKSIRRNTSISPTTIDSVNALYSALQDLFDESPQMDDGVPISAQTPTEYTIGIIDAGDKDPWFIDRTSAEYLSSGALKTNSWTRATGTNTGIVRINYALSGGFTTDFVASDIGKTVTSAVGDTGTLLDFNTAVSPKVAWIRPTNNTAPNNWDSTSGEIIVGSGTGNVNQSSAAVTGESLWANIYSLGTIVTDTHLYIYQNDSLLTKYKSISSDWWNDGQIDILVNVKEVGLEVDSGNLTVFARKYATLYDYYLIDASTGRNPVPLAAFSDRNNQTAEGTVEDYTGITFDFGATSQDLDNGNGTRPYDVIVDCGGNSVAKVYEYLKYVTRAGSSTTLNGVNGEAYTAVGDIRLNYSGESNGPFVEGNAITSDAGGSGYLVSLIDNGSTGTLVIRNVHGTFDDDNTLTSSGTTAVVNGTPEVVSPSKQAPFGTFAGGIFFGARGVFITNMDGADANSYQLTDSTGTIQIPSVTVNLTINIVDADGNAITENCEVTVVKNSDDSVLFHEDDITDGSTNYSYTTDAGTVTYINVFNVAGYQPKTVNNYTLPSSSAPLNIQLDEDRFYSNP